VSKKKCYAINTYLQFEKLIGEKSNKEIVIIYIKNYLIEGLGIDWLKTFINFNKTNYKNFNIKYYVDCGTDYGLSILILRENIDYLKLKTNKIILKKINQIAKKNKVLLNPDFDVVDISKIKK